ncbi:MAG: GNAT family N-acetyltransferase [Treponema sp.]|jgi:Leu/Phe-tRNA-protein transferase|nr:GNAT family N-acetyltransferase [Treponema sp.]
MPYPLRYTLSGHIFIGPEDDCDSVVDAMLATDYTEEFCIALETDPRFIARLMDAGFLVMSMKTEDGECILLPKLHLVRSALFFERLHVKKSIRRFLPRYELRPDAGFETILDRCVEVHGDDWLTPPLVEAIKQLRFLRDPQVRPFSFALYRDGRLAAGEFGIVSGRIYTSYSGYYEEDDAGTVQLVLASRWLEDSGFSFFDLGMPLPYKYDLGAVDIYPSEFVRLFRSGRNH